MGQVTTRGRGKETSCAGQTLTAKKKWGQSLDVWHYSHKSRWGKEHGNRYSTLVVLHVYPMHFVQFPLPPTHTKWEKEVILWLHCTLMPWMNYILVTSPHQPCTHHTERQPPNPCRTIMTLVLQLIKADPSNVAVYSMHITEPVARPQNHLGCGLAVKTAKNPHAANTQHTAAFSEAAGTYPACPCRPVQSILVTLVPFTAPGWILIILTCFYTRGEQGSHYQAQHSPPLLHHHCSSLINLAAKFERWQHTAAGCLL